MKRKPLITGIAATIGDSYVLHCRNTLVGRCRLTL
jgi:hypothetical protein